MSDHLHIITTQRRSTKHLVAEDVFCDRHWAEVKDRSSFQPDRRYIVTVRVIASDNTELNCQDCWAEEKARGQTTT